MARKPMARQCNYCGQTDLFWKSFNGSWRLGDIDGNLHRCDKAKRAGYKPDPNPGLPDGLKTHNMAEGEPFGSELAEQLKAIAQQGSGSGQGTGKASQGEGTEQASEGTEQASEQGEQGKQGSGKGAGSDMAQQVKGKSEGKIPSQDKESEGDAPGQGKGQTEPQCGPDPEGDDIYGKVRGHVLKDVDMKQGMLTDALCDAVGKELNDLKSADKVLAEALASTSARIDTLIDKAVKAYVDKPTRIVIKQPEGKPDVELPEGTRPEMADLIVAFREAQAAGMGVMLVGPAGSGKTTAGEILSKALALQYYPFSVGMQTSKSDLVGYSDANGRTVRPVFREAFEGGGLFLLDEVDAGNANVLTQLNAAIGNRYCSFPDGVIKAHESFGVLAAANTYGNGASRLYVGRNQLDAATLNRFVVMNWDYDHKLEKALGNAAWVERIHALRATQESLGLRVVISTRAVIVGTRLLAAGMSQRKMEDMVLWNAMSEDDREKLTKAAR